MGVGGAIARVLTSLHTTALPPSLTLPHKGGGNRLSLHRREFIALLGGAAAAGRSRRARSSRRCR